MSTVTTARGRADYSIEFQDGEILGVTRVKRQDYMLGIAQNAIQIRSIIDQKPKKVISLEELVVASPPIPECGIS